MAAVVVPARAGVLSAAGLLTAPEQRDLVRSWPHPLDHTGLPVALDALAQEAAAHLGARLAGTGADVAAAGASASSAVTTTALDVRYEGQSHELTVDSLEAFPAEHLRRNGYVRPGGRLEVIALRARAARESPVRWADLPPVPRQRVVGPAVLAEPDCTIWVPPGWRGEPGVAGALILRRQR